MNSTVYLIATCIAVAILVGVLIMNYMHNRWVECWADEQLL
jgi:hypothetical protein